MCTPGNPTSTLVTGTPDGGSVSMPVTPPTVKIPDTDSSARLALVTQGLGTVSSAAGAFVKASAESAAAKQNAAIATAAAINEQRVGDSTAQRLYAQTNQLKGTQRASLAARGLDLGTGSPLDILTSTDVMGAADQATNKTDTQLRVNADLNKAAFYKSQASNASPFVSAGSSLVTGAGKVADKWYDYKKAGNFANGFFGS